MVCAAAAGHEGSTDTNTSLSLTDLPRQPIYPQVLSDTGTYGNVSPLILSDHLVLVANIVDVGVHYSI